MILLGVAGALGCEPERPPPPLVLLLTADTLRADRVGAYGSGLDLTPHLDALAEESVVFERAYAAAPLTLPSLVALLASRHPEELGVEGNGRLRRANVPTLATLLQAAGWRTGAVVSHEDLRREVGLQPGFEVYDDELPQLEAARPLPERVARDTTDAALRVLDQLQGEGGGGILLWVHYRDPHGPYLPPESYRRRYLAREQAGPHGSQQLPVGRQDRVLGAIPRYQRVGNRRDVAFYRAGYAGEIRYMDEEIGRLLAGLRERGLYDPALIVFAADHGEALGEGRLWFAHGELLLDAVVHVPLMVRLPGVATSRRSDLVSLLDVLPTVLAQLGLEPPDELRGRDLLAPGASEGASTVYFASRQEPEGARFGIVADGFKYLVAERRGRRDERLFALDDESKDLARTQPERARELAARLGSLRDELAPPGAGRKRRLAPEERERLRALGYAEEADAR